MTHGYYLTYKEFFNSQIISLQGQNGFSKYLTQLKLKEKIIAKSKITNTQYYETICKFVKGEHIGY